ncbi:MAG: S9 family peptidase [Candidatus Aminicenantes bacterium]|nr:S9 family peptidase [Candidatus Aminicenantes bacterium]
MLRTRLIKTIGIFCFIALISVTAPFSFSTKKISVKDIYSPELMSKVMVPQYRWLSDDTLLLFDLRKKADERTFEILDPKTKRREQAVDRNRFLDGLKDLLGENAPKSVFWPKEMTDDAKLMLYELQGDLFCFERVAQKWHRLTKTDAQEAESAISPDGRWVSYTKNNDLYAVEWRSGKEIRLTDDGSETRLNGSLSWVYWEEIFYHTTVPYRWAPDSSAIAYLQTDDSEVSVSTFVNFKPDTQAVVPQRYPKAGQVNPDVKLGIVSLSNQKTTWVSCGTYEYIGRFEWLPDSGAISVQTLNRQQNHLQLYFADKMTGESRLILEEMQPAWINLNDTPHFLEDGRRFIWLSEMDGYQHLYLYDMAGKLIEQLTKGKYMVMSASMPLVITQDAVLGVDSESGFVYFSSNQESLLERHLYRVKLDGDGLVRLSSGKGVHASAFSPSRKFYVASYSSILHAPDLSLYQAEGKKILTIAPPADQAVADFNLAARTFHTYTADDDLEIQLMQVKPSDFDPGKKYPALVYIYGGPGAQVVVNRWPYSLWEDLLAQEGFVVFHFDVRAGMGKSKALETSVYREAYGIQNVRDILAGVRWVAKLPYIDSERLGIWGGSGGGCTTLYTMTHSDVFKAGISLYPVSDWHYYDTIYTERYQDTPQNNPEGYKETSSVLAAKDLKGRLLIVHGTYDDNVHPQNTEAFIDELFKHNIQFEMMIYPWQKHGIRGPYQSRHLFTIMLDFWKRHLK